jgi:hypothetical protein
MRSNQFSLQQARLVPFVPDAIINGTNRNPSQVGVIFN